MEESFQERLNAANREAEDLRRKQEEFEERKKTTPFLWNLNEDPLLSGKIIYFLEIGSTIVGRYLY